MKAKKINEAIKHLPGRKLNKKQQAEWDHRKEFDRIVNELEEKDDLLIECTEDFNIDPENLTITFNHSWSDDDYECDVTMTVNFRGGQIHLCGTCTNESIEVPGPGHMTAFEYDQEQEDSIDLDNISTEDFIEQINETMDDYCGNFSHFAQQEGEEEANNEYCPDCGELEEDCEKCENCGQCENVCDCEDEEDEDDEDDE